MEHRSDPRDYARRAARWAGVVISEAALDRLERYAEWLIDEAIPAGGLGPAEGPRLWQRHLADALTFATAWGESAPASLLDVGTGVGVPGIPLALVYPSTTVTLLDRAGRRIRLVERALRVLDLDAVTTLRCDVHAVTDRYEAVTFRGSLRPTDTLAASARLLEPGGTAMVGLSRRAAPPSLPPGFGEEADRLGLSATVTEVPVEVLDGASWLLMIRRSGHTSSPD